MKIEVRTKIGNVEYKFHIEEEDTKKALLMASVFGNTPSKCECGNEDNFALAGNKDKDGNVYINILCKSCDAKAKMGSYKNGGFFWYNRFERYVKNENKHTQTQAPETQAPANDMDWGD